MENTSKINAFEIAGTKLSYIIILTVVACLVSRGPILGNSFVCGISFIAYMLSRNTLNIYLVIPAAAGLLSYISRGYDPWGYIAAMIVCSLIQTATRKIPMSLWQRALITASAAIIAISIYSLAAGKVYLTSPRLMFAEGMIIVALMGIFDTFDRPRPDSLSAASFITMILLIINGMGFSFLIWFAIIFVSLWVLICIDVGEALFMVAAGAVWAYLMGHGQWGIMVTVMLGLLVASFAKGHGVILISAIFVCACWLCGHIDSGVVLGIDKYCLIIPTILFITLYWRFGTKMKKFIHGIMRKDLYAEEGADEYAEELLESRSAQMRKLSELYSTYLDNRSLLADQFDMTHQMMENLRWHLKSRTINKASVISEKIDMKIAISQCAASGNINGDCCGWQELDDGRMVMVVSDGMGKGKKAAAESLMVTKTMMALLKAGVSTDMALKMINTIMMIKDNEDSYATLDMIIVDKHTGKAKFYKIGAAPTLIRRKSNVEEVKLSAVPLGIVNGLKVKYVEAQLKKGDWIIMMSDGISDGVEGKSSGTLHNLHNIKETIAAVRSTDPETMGDLVMNRAIDGYVGRERDDMTVMVARIL